MGGGGVEGGKASQLQHNVQEISLPQLNPSGGGGHVDLQPPSLGMFKVPLLATCMLVSNLAVRRKSSASLPVRPTVHRFCVVDDD